MKLTKKLLAILLAAAMLFGMVVISTSAVQLDDAVASLTEDDCTTFDLENNPYKVKMGFKIYKVNTDDGSYELLSDTVAGNDTNDVNVQPGDVIRVEVWAQTNFHCYAIQVTPAYSNAWLLPTTQAFETFEMKVASTAEKISIEDGMPPMENFDDTYGAGDGTYENPIYINEALTYSKSQTNHNQYSGLKGVLPKTWKGTGTAETNWYSKTNTAILDENGKFKYNVYQFGAGYSAAGDEAYGGYAAVLNVYQPLVNFNLTVAEGATGTAELFIPEESLLSPSNTTGLTFFTALADVQNAGAYDSSTPQIVTGAGITQYKQYCLYDGDTTKYAKEWDIQNATITVDDGSGSGEGGTTTETTTEAPTEPPVEYADLTALKAAIADAANADTANCTADSVERFNKALAAANALNVEGTLKSEQGAVDAAAAELVAAQAALAKIVLDYTAWNTAEGKIPADLAAYTPASVEAYNTAKAAAEAAKATAVAAYDQAALDQAAADLEAAIALLAAKADKTALKAAIDDAPAYAADYYVNYTAYADALAAAQNVYADDNANADAVAAATKALTDAKAALTLKTADYTKVNEAKDAAAAIDATKYTEASVKAVTDAVAAVVEGYDITKQAEVDAMAKAINDAIDALAPLGTVDYTALDKAIAAYDALDKAAWTPASWTASDVDGAYAAAKAVARDLIADEAGANQATVNAAADALDTAIKALVAVADKADLAAAIAAAPTDADAYTPDTWAPFAAALATANEVNADANATQDAVNNALTALTAAQGNLALKADKGALADAIAGAKALDEADYTPDSWAAAKLADVIAAAEAVNNDANASDAEVTAAIKALRDAALVLVEKADTEALEEAIATLPVIKEEDADPESWAAYKAALAAAELVFADANATQDEVDKAEADLLAAISAVKEKDVVYCDYTALDKAIADFEALDAAQYTPASYAIVKAYYDAAKAVARDMEYSLEAQDEIDFAADELNNSIALDLVKVADKTALKAAIDTVVDTANCTSASIAKYEAALADANAVYADANATQQAVDAAKDALVAAQTLEKLPKIDYTDLKDAMAKFEALDAAEWTDDSYAAAKAAYDVAADLVEEDLYDDEAGVNAIRVDEATDALDTAIGALKAAVKKDALLAEINKAASIEEDLATDATWADYANALANAQDVYADDAATQEDVDDATAELAAANAALALRDLVDYTALDAALALVPAEAQDAYTPASWQAYANAKAAAEKVDRALVDNKAGTNQKLVDNAAAKLVAAFNGLKVNAANITNVAYDNTDYFAPATLAYAFTVNGAPSKIQVLSPDGGTMTFDRRSTKVNIVSYNANNEVVDYADEDPAYEIWTINLVLKADDYQVRAKYDYTWDTEYFDFTVEYDEYDTNTATFAASVAGGEAATAVEAAKGEVITFTAVTDATAIKVQFMFADGGTSTYSQNKSVNNGDGTRTWTITRVFSRSQDINLRVKAPTGWGESIGNVVVTIK